MQEEIWKSIKGFEDKYLISNFGRVLSLNYRGIKNNKKIMHLSDNKKGYKVATLCSNGKASKIFVHRLVAEAFISNPDNYPIINHKDENPSNNFVENLEWCNHSYNARYNDSCVKRGLKYRGVNHPLYGKRLSEDKINKMREYLRGVKRNPNTKMIFRKAHTKGFRIYQKDMEGKIVNTYLSSIEAYEKTGIAARNIRLCCEGKQKTAGGYRWERVKINQE